MSDTTLNRFVASGTTAERLAFIPSPPSPASGPAPGYTWWDTDLEALYAWDADTSTWVAAGGGGDMTGPGSATDNALTRFDGTTGKVVQSGPVTEGDDGTLSNLTDPTSLQDAATKNYVDTQIAAVNVGGASQNSFLVSGGQVVWESNYTFIVSAATYYISGVLYSSPETSITLSAADPTNDRIDTVAVDDAGTVVVVEGTPAAQPSEPQLDPATQLKLSIVLVTAGTTAPPTIATTLVYADDAGSPTEWNWTTSGTGFDVSSTANPRGGSTHCIEGTAVANNAYAQGEIGSGTFDPATANFLVFYIQSKATWANKRVLVLQLQSSGVIVGAPITIKSGAFGFDSSQTSSYQQIAIPVEQFAVPTGTTINQLRIRDSGGSIGFYIDDISWQGGVTTSAAQGITQAQADVRYAFQGAITGSLLTMVTSRLLGRTTASSGPVEEIAVGAGLFLSSGTLSASGTATPPFTLLTADPGSPTDDTWWVVREGTSPAETVSVKARIGGVTYTIAALTI